jgi:hypothetical protein
MKYPSKVDSWIAIVLALVAQRLEERHCTYKLIDRVEDR